MAVLGLIAAGWAFFLWWQLLRSRSGLEPVCIGSSQCAELWDAAFATLTHRYTGLPVAAWGAVWGAVAAFLPLRALSQLTDGNEDGPWIAATRWLGALGLVGVVVLLAVSAGAGLFCGSCAVTYAVTVLYGLLGLWGLSKDGWKRQGLTAAAVATLVAWGIFLYPGIRTPKNVLKESQKAFAEAAAAGEETASDAPARVQEPVHTNKSVVPADNPLRIATWPLDAEEQDRRLRERLAEAPPDWLEVFSGALDRYRKSEPAPDAAPPRHLKGQADADVRLTVFTDSQCGHCAQLHGAIEVLSALFPPGAFNVDSRHFPLDGRCNAYLSPNPGRASCFAAKARICIEDQPDVWQLETEIYRLGQEMDEEKIYALLENTVSRDELASCVASPSTASKLRMDVEHAMHYDPSGTPVVLVDGKLLTQDPMMIYLVILAGGDADHPAFGVLPPPPEGGYDEHAGHNH